MKYLQDYMEKRQTEAFDKAGAFFAFGNDQLKEKRVDGVEYWSLGGGLICPKGNEKELIDTLDLIWKESIAQDLAENGKEKIILRELANHEAWYTMDIESTKECLEPYGFTEKEIYTMFRNRKAKL